MSTLGESLPRTLGVCLLGALVAVVLVVATQTRGFAQAADDIVRPGESIQRAINAADPGDTIVVRGVHREDVIITKNGIKLRGEGDAVIEAPPRAKADSPCSKAYGPEAICVWGDFNINTGEITGPRVSDVSVSGFTIRGFDEADDAFVIDVYAARNATIVGNRAIGNDTGGIVTAGSVNTTIAKNHVIGSPETDAQGILVDPGSRNTTVVKNVVRSIPEGHVAIEVEEGMDTTIAGNDLIGNWFGVLAIDSTGTKILSNDIPDSTLSGMLILDSTGTKIVSNDISSSGEAGIAMFGPERAKNDAKVVGNRISGGAWGILLQLAHGGSFTGNTIRNNCAGMFFEASPSEPVGGFEVKANTVEDNTRSCRAAQFDRNFSGIGIALLGTRDMEVTGNQISGNVPSGPTPVSGGVVVVENPYDDSRGPKPTNNSVTGNNFGRNKPDIFYDGSGSGNSFIANNCDTSVPSRLCN